MGQIVDGSDRYFVFSFADQVCDIRGERKIALFMGNRFLPVNPDRCFPADSPEVKQDSLPLPFLRQGEVPGIHHFPAVFHLQVQTGKQAFRTERNPYFRFCPAAGKLPLSVQAQPVFPYQLRTWVRIPGSTGQRFSG